MSAVVVGLLGRGILLVGCSAAGFYLAGRSKRRRKELLLARSFLGELSARLRFQMQPAGELIALFCRQLPFAQLPCLRQFALDGGKFPQGWQQAVKSCGGDLLPGDREILCRLSGILGAYELQAQLEEIAQLRAQLEEAASQAAQLAERENKLYTSLGPLVGLALCIVL